MNNLMKTFLLAIVALALLAAFGVLGYAETSSGAQVACDDGTSLYRCSANKPLQCAQSSSGMPSLISNCAECGCPENSECLPGNSCKANAANAEANRDIFPPEIVSVQVEPYIGKIGATFNITADIRDIAQSIEGNCQTEYQDIKSIGAEQAYEFFAETLDCVRFGSADTKYPVLAKTGDYVIFKMPGAALKDFFADIFYFRGYVAGPSPIFEAYFSSDNKNYTGCSVAFGKAKCANFSGQDIYLKIALKDNPANGSVILTKIKVGHESGRGIGSAYAVILAGILPESSAKPQVIPLYDDSTHPNFIENDGIYGNSFDSSGYADGEYSAKATANDRAGNAGESEPAKFYIFDPTLCQEAAPAHNNISSERINIIVRGVGYPDMNEFKDIADKVFDFSGNGFGIFSAEPFLSNKGRFNVWWVNKSADLFYPPHCDFLDKKTYINLGNKDFRSNAYLCYPYNSISCRTGDPSCPRVALHEFAHSFGCLFDEYVEEGAGDWTGYPNCADSNKDAEEWWGDLAGQGEKPVLNVGYFSGCSYVSDNIRPTYDSLMNFGIYGFDKETYTVGFGYVNSRHICKQIRDHTGSAGGYCDKFGLEPLEKQNALEVTVFRDNGALRAGNVSFRKNVIVPVKEDGDYRLSVSAGARTFEQKFDMHSAKITEYFDAGKKTVGLAGIEKMDIQETRILVPIGESYLDETGARIKEKQAADEYIITIVNESVGALQKVREGAQSNQVGSAAGTSPKSGQPAAKEPEKEKELKDAASLIDEFLLKNGIKAEKITGIAEMNMTAKKIKIREKRNFLGLVPVIVESEIVADVEAQSAKTAGMPWWAFLAW